MLFVQNEINAVVTKPKRRNVHENLPEGVGLIKPKLKDVKSDIQLELLP